MRYSRHLLLIVFGLLTGASIGVVRITHWTGSDATMVNGPWRGHNLTDVGTSRLLTARVAVAALYALRSDEALYLVAREDDRGMALSAQHEYVIKGVPIPSRYWSITMYGEDYFLIPNKINRYGFNRANLHYQSDSSFVIHVSSARKEGNWLPSEGEGRFYLVLRLYHPVRELYENIGTAKLPSVQRLD